MNNVKVQHRIIIQVDAYTVNELLDRLRETYPDKSIKFECGTRREKTHTDPFCPPYPTTYSYYPTIEALVSLELAYVPDMTDKAFNKYLEELARPIENNIRAFIAKEDVKIIDELVSEKQNKQDGILGRVVKWIFN